MALDATTKSIQLRAITIIGAGAAILAVIGYLLMKSDRKKPKRRSSKSSNSSSLNINSIDTDQYAELIRAAEEAINNVEMKGSNLNKSSSEEASSCQAKEEASERKQEEHDVKDETNISEPVTLNLEDKQIKNDKDGGKVNDTEPKQHHSNDTDKLSEYSSDSGNGQSEMYLLNQDVDECDACSDDVNNNNNVHINSNSSLNSKQEDLIIEEAKLKELVLDDVKNEESVNNQKSTKKPISKVSSLTKSVLPNSKSTSSVSSATSSRSNSSTPNNTATSNTTANLTTNTTNTKKKSSMKTSQSQPLIAKTNNSKANNVNKKLDGKTAATATKKSSNTNSSNLLKQQPSNKRISESSNSSSTNTEDIVVYEFNFPTSLCGKLIGRNGIHVDYIRSETHTQIGVRDDPSTKENQIVCVSGRLEDVDRALDIIAERFPAKTYPNISFKPISKPIVYRRYNPNKANELYSESKVLVASNMFVDLPSVIQKSGNNDLIDVNVTAVVSTAHVFIQLPTNPTYDELQKLDENMLKSYSNIVDEKIPMMVEPIEYGTICVAPTSYGWHRAMVTYYEAAEDIKKTTSDYSETCGLATVKFLDYGGYLTIPANQLRQLRSDFMLLPFQAVECYLDGIYPIEGLEEEGKNFLSELIKSSSRLQATVTGYAFDGVPFIRLSFINKLYGECNVNNELVNYGFATYNTENNQIVNNLNSNYNNEYPILSSETQSLPV